MKKTALLTFLVFTVILPAAGVDTISVMRPVIAPDTNENRMLVDDVLKRSAVLASRRCLTIPFYDPAIGVSATELARLVKELETVVHRAGSGSP